MERRRDLVEVFGSKKSKRIVKSREENVVNLENVSGVSTVTKTLKSKIDDAAQRIRDEKAKDASYSSGMLRFISFHS
jgi:DNA-directed RNA polymerase I subunit RPA49